MGFIVSSTGSFSSGFVVMTALAVVGAGSMLVLPRHRPRLEVSAAGGKAGLAVGQR